MKILIDPANARFLASALKVAAEMYQEDAKNCAAAGSNRTADTFTAYAKRATALSEALEAAHDTAELSVIGTRTDKWEVRAGR
jgi:hypothetical protein